MQDNLVVRYQELQNTKRKLETEFGVSKRLIKDLEEEMKCLKTTPEKIAKDISKLEKDIIEKRNILEKELDEIYEFIRKN